MKKATSLEQVFMIVTAQACSWFDYKLINDLICKLGDDNDKKLLGEYEKKYKSFAEQRKLPKGKKHIEIGNGAKEGCKKLVIKIDKEWDEVNFNDLDRIRGNLASILNVKRSDLYLADIREGCIIMTFKITEELAEILFPKKSGLTSSKLSSCLTPSKIKLLKDEGVILFACGKLSWRSAAEQKEPELQYDENDLDVPSEHSNYSVDGPRQCQVHCSLTVKESTRGSHIFSESDQLQPNLKLRHKLFRPGYYHRRLSTHPPKLVQLDSSPSVLLERTATSNKSELQIIVTIGSHNKDKNSNGRPACATYTSDDCRTSLHSTLIEKKWKQNTQTHNAEAYCIMRQNTGVEQKYQPPTIKNDPDAPSGLLKRKKRSKLNNCEVYISSREVNNFKFTSNRRQNLGPDSAVRYIQQLDSPHSGYFATARSSHAFIGKLPVAHGRDEKFNGFTPHEASSRRNLMFRARESSTLLHAPHISGCWTSSNEEENGMQKHQMTESQTWLDRKQEFLKELEAQYHKYQLEVFLQSYRKFREECVQLKQALVQVKVRLEQLQQKPMEPEAQIWQLSPIFKETQHTNNSGYSKSVAHQLSESFTTRWTNSLDRDIQCYGTRTDAQVSMQKKPMQQVFQGNYPICSDSVRSQQYRSSREEDSLSECREALIMILMKLIQSEKQLMSESCATCSSYERTQSSSIETFSKQETTNGICVILHVQLGSI